MRRTDLAPWRLRTQRITGPPAPAPEAVVAWLGAVQSQDYGPATWSVGQRMEAPADAEVDGAFDAGTILRTHVLRPTWHFVCPADIRWLLTATAPRVHALNAHYYRKLGLDAATLAKSDAIIAEALRDGNHLTRTQLGAVLADAGLAASGLRLVYVLMHAELEALVCSGPRRGKQHTYALLDERAPDARDLPREAALAELASRFFTAHGPATARDLQWWSSLTMAEIATALEAAAAHLHHDDLDGVRFWFAEPPPDRRPPGPSVHLVQGFDEYLNYGESRFALDLTGAGRMEPRERSVFNHVVLLDGQVAGRWKRTVRARSVQLDVALYLPFDEAQRRALSAAAERHAAFLDGRTAHVATVD